MMATKLEMYVFTNWNKYVLLIIEFSNFCTYRWFSF